MAQDNNFFALLADEEGDDVMELINRVKEEEKENSSLVERLQEEKKEEKKMAPWVPTDMRAKRLILPNDVQRSFIVIDKKKERENAEEVAKPKVSVESNGDQEEDRVRLGANDNRAGEQPVNGNFSASDNSNSRLSTNLNGYHGKSRTKRNGCQQSNGYNGSYEGKYRGANGYQQNNGGHYQRSYKGSNSKNGVSNCDQLNNGGDSNGNDADDGWRYVGRRRRGKGRGAYQEYVIPEEDGTRHGSLEESNRSEKESEKSVNGDENGDMTKKESLDGEQAVGNDLEDDLHVTTEGQEDAQSENKSFNEEEGKSQVTTDGQEDAQSEKKSNEGDDGTKSGKKPKKKKKKKVTQDNVEKKEEKRNEERKNFMTLKEYEKKCLHRKSLEAFKRPEQRKVEDKDFESMQLIGKKKEESQLKYEDKLKKKDNKELKFRKTLITSEILKPALGWTLYKHGKNGDRPYRRPYTERSNGEDNGENHNDNGHEGRRPYGELHQAKPDGRFAGERPHNQHDSETPAAAASAAETPTFAIEHHQFPALRGNGKA